MHKIQDAKIEGQKILLRVDFNVPMKGMEIENDKRIRESLPTIQYLLDHGAAKIMLITHLGKPEGAVNAEFSLWPVANRLAELLGSNAKFSAIQEGFQINEKVVLLENIRFFKGEEENDVEFARSLAREGSLFVNDAFGTCHRAHASTAAVATLLPAYAGLLVQKEVAVLEKILQKNEKPFTVILGGAKIADKLPTIKNLMTRADNFLIGGAIANTFLAARRHYMGKSLVEKEAIKDAHQIWQNLMDDSHKALYLPTDLLLSKSSEAAEDLKTVNISELQEDKYSEYLATDIGPKTIEEFKKVIAQSKTIFWNGNMGVSEIEEFANGTNEIAQAIIDSGAQAVIGGGDTVAAVEKVISNSLSVTSIDNNTNNQLPITNNLFLSTGGGATLEFLAGKVLPGLKALE